MTPDPFFRLQEAFRQANELDTRERTVFLTRLRTEDPGLYGELSSLLQYHDMGESRFLEEPAVTPDFLRGTLDSARAGGPTTRLVGKKIGSYEIQSLVGQGGMGAVYRAERADGAFKMVVALKVINPFLHDRGITRRFHREREVLARLEHPNIARLLDGGTTEEGMPYLVMEFVEGLPLDLYCDQARLTIDQRVDLFRKICEAIHHAHRSLVLHCDIKSRNILVGADGEPKVLDFGIARLLLSDQDTAGGTTTTAGRFLTPESASPEQIQGHPLTTASDVYSLGVVLYELLSGHRPYALTGLSPAEMERRICQEEIARPSTVTLRARDRHGTDAPQGPIPPDTLASHRRTTPQQLHRLLLGDLDHIVLKALRKEPELRYESAKHLAEDLRHYRVGLPVEARRGTFAYRAQRFLTRHRAHVAGAAALLLALFAGAFLLVRDARRETHQLAVEHARTHCPDQTLPRHGRGGDPARGDPEDPGRSGRQRVPDPPCRRYRRARPPRPHHRRRLPEVLSRRLRHRVAQDPPPRRRQGGQGPTVLARPRRLPPAHRGPRRGSVRARHRRQPRGQRRPGSPGRRPAAEVEDPLAVQSPRGGDPLSRAGALPPRCR